MRGQGPRAAARAARGGANTRGKRDNAKRDSAKPGERGRCRAFAFWVGICGLIGLGAVAFLPVVAYGDVTGTLTLETVLHPTQSPSSQAEERVHIVDFRAHLAGGIQTSGLLLQVDSLMGTPGFEHVVLTASGTLGALNLRALAAFARPYASVSLTSDFTGPINAFTFIVPIGPTLFVTHRVETSLSVLGVLLKNVAIFEDVNFQHPFSTLTLSPGDPLPVLPTYTAQSQSFRFGDVLTVQGQFYNGSTLTMVVGINADPAQGKAIKGHGFPGAVVDSEILTFVKEIISLQGWRVGQATLGLSATFEDDRISAAGSLRYPLSWGTLTAAFASPAGGFLPLVPTSVSAVLTPFPLTLTLGLDPMELKITNITGSTNFPLSAISSVALQLVGTPGVGLQSLTAALVVNHPGGFVFSGRVNLFPDAPLVGTATVTAHPTPFLSVQGTVQISPKQPQPQVLQARFSATYRF